MISKFSLKTCANAFRSHEAVIQYVREGNPGTPSPPRRSQEIIKLLKITLIKN